ncbi:hypothetical protein GPALN_009732 [Globodera pallida]|nr:hypothetical protein GPALN_009732 [Globodera pallida]
MTKSAHLAMRASRKGQCHPRRQRPYQGTGQGVELRRPLTNAPLIQAYPEHLAVNFAPLPRFASNQVAFVGCVCDSFSCFFFSSNIA